MDSARAFFSDQKGKMNKHMNEALENGDKKDADRGSKKK